MRKEESLIAFLNNKFKSSTTNEVAINPFEVSQIGLTEQETIQSLYLLEEDGLLIIIDKSVHDDFSRFWKVALKSACIHYFEDKTKKQNLKIKEWIWWSITTLISIGALIVAIVK